MGSYELCATCKKPQINENNLFVLRKRTLLYVGGGCVVGGLLGGAVLPIMGFGSAGVADGSMASSWKSSIGLVSAGSTFSLLQSLGATGSGIILFGSVGAVGGGGALGLIHKHASKFGWRKYNGRHTRSNLLYKALYDEFNLFC